MPVTVFPTQSGLEPDEPVFTGNFGWGCQHPQHNIPQNLCIPQGMRYRHICPGCGLQTVVRPAANMLTSGG